MKGDIIDIFADSFGWLLGKAALFVLAVIMGVAMGAVALAAGAYAGGGSFGFASSGPPVLGHLTVAAVILPLAAAMFWAGMWFVRSENAGIGSWGGVSAGLTLLVTGAFCMALPGGWLAQAVAWSLAFVLPAMLGVGLWFFRQWRVQRWAASLVELQAINAARRAELREKFGTETAGSQELGIGSGD